MFRHFGTILLRLHCSMAFCFYSYAVHTFKKIGYDILVHFFLTFMIKMIAELRARLWRACAEHHS